VQLNTLLDNYLSFELRAASHSAELRRTIDCLAGSATELARKITQNSLIELQGSIEQVAFGLFEGHLRDAPIGMLISENFEEPQLLSPESGLAVVIHPLEGVTNFRSAMPFGSIFSIHDLKPSAAVQDISTATIAAAGFFVYGPQTLLVLSFGRGVGVFTLNLDSGEFMLSREQLFIPAKKSEFAIDAANYRFWDSSLKHYFDDCVSGADGPLGIDFDMHWNDSMVVEAYRVLTSGGVYLFPDDARPGFGNGKHKLLYEAIPVAFLIEQANGKATDGYEPIRDKSISQVDACVPLIFGAVDAVEQVLRYFDGNATESTDFPLFENRSLFRN